MVSWFDVPELYRHGERPPNAVFFAFAAFR